MLRTTLARSGCRHLWARSTLARNPVLVTKTPTTHTTAPILSPSHPRLYSCTPAIFQKHSSNLPKHSSTSASASASTKDDEKEVDPALLSADDDLMVGNEGLESIDPRDFPELYPRDEDMEGLSQASHPDGERDYEGLDAIKDTIMDDRADTDRSVLLSDKPRTEDEFSWFVDESYSERASGDKEDEGESGFVPLWQKNAQRAAEGAVDDRHDEQLDLLHGEDGEHSSVNGLVKLLESERARNVKVIDMRDKCDWTNWMVIAEGLSERHLGNVADEVYRALKKSSPKSSPPVMEGRDTSDWVVIDAGSVVIHFMTPEARKERDLEGLWASVKSPLKLKDAEEITWEDVKGKMTKAWKENPGRSKGEDGKRGRRGERDIPLSEVVKW
ncbi:hypothetical protein BG006_000498 [Podila minutissima]|uniref:Uncharacterized protein n=1 Tax=Podila minutissima TaxID=64525 RepID=A0A9P5SDV9_9FUNG|nr:hypothetical protein BG006_000498 [Podila minutissima]